MRPLVSSLRSSRLSSFAFAFALALASSLPSAVAHAQDPRSMPPAAAAAIDNSVTAVLDSGRAAVKAHPGGWYEAQVFAQQVDQAFSSGTPARGKVDGNALTTEAIGYLDAAMKVSPDQSVKMLAMKAVMLKDAGRMDEAKAVAKQAEDMYAAQTGAKTAPSAPAAPAPVTSVSVTVTSKCPKTVSIGTAATPDDATPSDLAPAAEAKQSFAPGDVVWLFDKNGKTLSHARIRATTKTVTVGKSCRSVVSR